MPLCCLCEHPVERWLAHPRQAERSRFMVLMDTVGSDLSVFSCPHCGSTDRDRHLWLYLQAAGLLPLLAGASVLHLAPEVPLEARIAAAGPARYERGDLQPVRAGHIRLDAHALPFDDESFDLVIANHLLEHVRDPSQVLGEFRRCLRPGGVLVAQTPYAPRLARTFEMLTPVDADFATLFYGQSDHVRLFGADLEGLFGAAGFEGRLLPHDAVLPGIDGAEFGINPKEPFFVFTRPAALAAAA